MGIFSEFGRELTWRFSAVKTDWRRARRSNLRYRSFRCKWLTFSELTWITFSRRLLSGSPVGQSVRTSATLARVEKRKMSDSVAECGHFRRPDYSTKWLPVDSAPSAQSGSNFFSGKIEPMRANFWVVLYRRAGSNRVRAEMAAEVWACTV